MLLILFTILFRQRMEQVGFGQGGLFQEFQMHLVQVAMVLMKH